ncbi:MAG: gamma-glutamyl-gamma-aminobutyrate hydrolase family protein [Verrucomicrobia bacterium]|nr:gamma-glutamyl-gamma-aminobutyrate hydrolase family protein [Verrucomicrobiota bacterium]
MSAVAKQKPLIALTPAVQERSGGGLNGCINKEYTDAVLAAGGLPMVLPLTDDEAALAALLAPADGLLLTGGGDVNPALFGGDPANPKLGSVSRLRDTMELFLTRRLLDEGRRPVLGICRGCQVMNVAAGGTLALDLPSEIGAAVNHSDPRHFELVHDVEIVPGTRLHALVGATAIRVNSAHHQAVKDLAPRLRVSARSTRDGVVEAVELDGSQFFLGAQWHPERLHDRHEPSAALFRALVAAAS